RYARSPGRRRLERAHCCPARRVATAPAAGERLFAQIVAEYGLPTPEREVEFHLSDGRTVYVDWVFRRVVGVEIDSYTHHSSLIDWSADHTRNNLLRAMGLTLLNITYPMLKYDRPRAAATVE